LPELKDDIDRAVAESARKLLAVAPPPVRYWLLWDVMQRPDDDEELASAVEDCRKYPPRLKLLSEQRADGTWPISPSRRMAEEAGPGPPYGWTYVTMLRNLDELTDSLTTKDEGHVGMALEKILGWQADDGHIPGPTERFPLPHYNGYALRNMVVLGAGGDPRVRRLRAWLLARQREDGGWVIPYVQDAKYLPQYRNMKMREFVRLANGGQIPYDPGDSGFADVPSCIWTTMMVVRGLVAGLNPKVDRRVRRGAGFFLDRFFKENHHSTFYKDSGHWTRLRYPTYFGSGLCALDILTSIGYGPDDARMERPIRWLLDMRSKDGFWSQSDRPHPEKDMWITEVALSILARYSRMC
jgi:hypothetical protein